MHFDSANEIWFFYETSAAYVIYTFSKQFDIAGEIAEKKCKIPNWFQIIDNMDCAV